MRKSKFCFPKVATVKLHFASTDSAPAADTVWLSRKPVPFSSRIADQAAWHALIEKLG